MWQQLVWIGVGGALGALSRYGVGLAAHALWPGRFPWGTLLVNAVGSLCIGLVFVWVAERGVLGAEWRGVLIVGFLGAFTTFSTFSLESVALLERGDYILAGSYIVLSVLVCLLAAMAGLYLARAF